MIQSGKIEVIGSGNLDQAIQEYDSLAELGFNTAIKYQPTSVLTPVEVNTLLEKMLNERFRNENTWIDGYFISGILRNSYTAGNTDFVLNTGHDQKISYLASNLRAKKRNPISIHIIGDLGYGAGKDSRYVELNVDGSVDDAFGLNSDHLTGYIGESAGTMFGMQSRYFNGTIIKQVGMRSGENSRDSIFKSPNPDTVLKILKSVPRTNRSKRTNNKVYFMQYTGEELVRFYNRHNLF